MKNLKGEIIFHDEISTITDQRIRPVIYMFMAFEMAMLFQTSYYGLGTIVSGTISILIVITYLYETHIVKVRASSIFVFFYTGVLVGTSVFTAKLDSKFFQLIVYVVLYLLLSSLQLQEKEARYVVGTFVLASLFYAILIIQSRLKNPLAYVHSDIVLFGTQLDPNYVGLPLVVAFSLLLFNLFHEGLSLKGTCALSVLTVAIILTSSRGNFLSLMVCIGGNIFYFIKHKSIKWQKKVSIGIGVVFISILFYSFAMQRYQSFLERIFDFSRNDISNGRFDLWRQALDIWWKRPIFGSGYESLGRAIGMGVHNTYIQILCDTGLIGALFFFAFITSIIIRAYHKSMNLFICSLGILCHSCFLGAISSRCFWVAWIMIEIVLTRTESVVCEKNGSTESKDS